MMFKRNRDNDPAKNTLFSFGFHLFYAHIANVILMIVTAMLVENLSLLKIEAPESLSSIAVTVVCFVFYVVYVYVQSWRVGERDHNLVLYNHRTYQPWRPVYAALISQSVGIVLVILAQFPSLGFTWVRYARYYYLNFNWFLLNIGENYRAIFFVPVLIPFLIAPAAYHMGYRGIYLADKLVFSVPKDGEKKK